MEKTPLLTVSDFIALTNQTLEYAYPTVAIEGEVASFKVNQGKFVFFDLKDASGSIGCFMMLFQLRQPIEDGMKVIITGAPKLTQWGKFSITVRSIQPSGEGALKKSFELLKEKLDKEGLFAPERKRPLPYIPQRVAVITSTDAAGYADFVKILNERWGGLQVEVAHTQVQGASAPDQMIRAIKYLNEQEVLPEVLVLIRGGGSADDLAAYNDEPLVRAIAASRIPTLVGVGHEVDESLADLVADVRAATPSNAAQLLVPDRHDIIRSAYLQVSGLQAYVLRAIEQLQRDVHQQMNNILTLLQDRVEKVDNRLLQLRAQVTQLNPRLVLKRGYALLRGAQTVGSVLEIETDKAILKAEVQDVRKK